MTSKDPNDIPDPTVAQEYARKNRSVNSSLLCHEWAMGARLSQQILRRRTVVALHFAWGRSVTRRLLIPAFFLTLHVQASEWLPTRLYDVTIETGMPHLEENLRYTTTHQRSCISLKDLATEFPILNHPTLAGCTLGGETRTDDTVRFGLSCDDRHGTTGTAVCHSPKRQNQERHDLQSGGTNIRSSRDPTAQDTRHIACTRP